MFCRTLTNRFAVYMYGSISQFPSVIGLLLTGFIADRLGVENIFIIGGVATPKHFKHFSYLCAIINNIQSLIYG